MKLIPGGGKLCSFICKLELPLPNPQVLIHYCSALQETHSNLEQVQSSGNRHLSNEVSQRERKDNSLAPHNKFQEQALLTKLMQLNQMVETLKRTLSADQNSIMSSPLDQESSMDSLELFDVPQFKAIIASDIIPRAATLKPNKSPKFQFKDSIELLFSKSSQINVKMTESEKKIETKKPSNYVMDLAHSNDGNPQKDDLLKRTQDGPSVPKLNSKCKSESNLTTRQNLITINEAEDEVRNSIDKILIPSRRASFKVGSPGAIEELNRIAQVAEAMLQGRQVVINESKDQLQPIGDENIMESTLNSTEWICLREGLTKSIEPEMSHNKDANRGEVGLTNIQEPDVLGETIVQKGFNPLALKAASALAQLNDDAQLRSQMQLG
jgi:hypothetical protein